MNAIEFSTTACDTSQIITNNHETGQMWQSNTQPFPQLLIQRRFLSRGMHTYPVDSDQLMQGHCCFRASFLVQNQSRRIMYSFGHVNLAIFLENLLISDWSTWQLGRVRQQSTIPVHSSRHSYSHSTRFLFSYSAVSSIFRQAQHPIVYVGPEV
jgi:hypothetical protein